MKVLLTNEKFIKDNSNLSDNLYGKFLLPAMREAQEIGLQQIVGQNLYVALCDKVSGNTLTGVYKTLMDDYVQWYLLYKVMSDIVDIIDVKMSNIGTVRNKDEYVENISDGERVRLKAHYQDRCNFYTSRMQSYLIVNYNSFPELGADTYNKIKAELKSSETCGIWLKGARGYRLR